ncbi:flagellar basal body P-ring formation chaperone FlgA [Chelativorans intermedius]|uniref:Flagella basal body P-ring formation protein FlgA n=1 Tax=Chelativorans intermedius TaxID=515947 RepID=A0ABV6D8S7_9HYPH|nr:flagellar basal body P-ring formation chaperone FlgA [Chelativorans intermedius]MCT8997785.1 flagellar basal body P-ring formation chaperone FlgA [Chelativorans intermedius]
MSGFPGRRVLLAGLLATLACAPLPAVAQDMVVVPVRVIYPGETVTAEALREVVLRRPQRHMAEVARGPEELDGKVARRTLLPGRLVPLSSVREPYLVEQGTAVTVVFTAGALTISLVAVPLQSGAAGDLIRLRNLDSGAVITGTVMSDGTVRVGAS